MQGEYIRDRIAQSIAPEDRNHNGNAHAGSIQCGLNSSDHSAQEQKTTNGCTIDGKGSRRPATGKL
jgi:hypothetical protein